MQFPFLEPKDLLVNAQRELLGWGFWVSFHAHCITASGYLGFCPHDEIKGVMYASFPVLENRVSGLKRLIAYCF